MLQVWRTWNRGYKGVTERGIEVGDADASQLKITCFLPLALILRISKLFLLWYFLFYLWRYVKWPFSSIPQVYFPPCLFFPSPTVPFPNPLSCHFPQPYPHVYSIHSSPFLFKCVMYIFPLCWLGYAGFCLLTYTYLWATFIGLLFIYETYICT